MKQLTTPHILVSWQEAWAGHRVACDVGICFGGGDSAEGRVTNGRKMALPLWPILGGSED